MIAKLQYVAKSGVPIEIIGPVDEIFAMAKEALKSGLATFVMVQDSVAAIEEAMDSAEPMVQELTRMFYPGALR